MTQSKSIKSSPAKKTSSSVPASSSPLKPRLDANDQVKVMTSQSHPTAKRPMSSARRKVDIQPEQSVPTVIPSYQSNVSRDIPSTVTDEQLQYEEGSKSTYVPLKTGNEPNTFMSSGVSSRKSPIPLSHASRISTPDMLRSNAGSRASKKGGDDYGYDDDFEAYDDDFEDFEEQPATSKFAKPSRVAVSTEISDVKKALEEENNRIMQSKLSNSPDRSVFDSNPSSPIRSSYASPTRHEPYTSALPERQVVDIHSAFKTMQSAKTQKSQAFVTAQKRANDLREMIDLDFAIYDNLFDLPPLNEYELFMRNLAVSGIMHEGSQTKEDMLFPRETQTEDWWIEDKWTAAPATETDDCGSVPTSLPWLEHEYTPEKEWSDMADRMKKLMRNIDSIRLARFLKKSCHVLDILLEEIAGDEQSFNIYSGKAVTSISRGYSSLAVSKVLLNSKVHHIEFSPGDFRTILISWKEVPNYIHKKLPTFKGIIAVYRLSDPTKPHRILVCDGEITSCSFCPSVPYLIIAGTKDGSIQVWDIRETEESSHSSLWTLSWSDDGSIKIPLIIPSYSTDGSYTNNTIHQDEIAHVQFLHTYSDRLPQSGVGQNSSFQNLNLISIDASGTFQLWSLSQYETLVQAETDADIGMAPGSIVKLIPSQKRCLKIPYKNPYSKELKVCCAVFPKRSSGKFLIGTDMGFIHLSSKFGEPCHPSILWPIEPPSTALPYALDVTSISFSDHVPSVFLASFGNGEVALFSTSLTQALRIWQISSFPILQVLWSPIRACVFYALDGHGTTYIFDLAGNFNSGPRIIKAEEWDGRKEPNHIPTCLALSSGARGSHSASSTSASSIVVGYKDGCISVHLLDRELNEPEIDEDQTFLALIDRFTQTAI